MKMTAVDYKALRELLQGVVEQYGECYGVDTVPDFGRALVERHGWAPRFARWKLFYMIPAAEREPWLARVYTYGNKDCINAALYRITGLAAWDPKWSKKYP